MATVSLVLAFAGRGENENRVNTVWLPLGAPGSGAYSQRPARWLHSDHIYFWGLNGNTLHANWKKATPLFSEADQERGEVDGRRDIKDSNPEVGSPESGRATGDGAPGNDLSDLRLGAAGGDSGSGVDDRHRGERTQDCLTGGDGVCPEPRGGSETESGAGERIELVPRTADNNAQRGGVLPAREPVFPHDDAHRVAGDYARFAAYASGAGWLLPSELSVLWGIVGCESDYGRVNARFDPYDRNAPNGGISQINRAVWENWFEGNYGLTWEQIILDDAVNLWAAHIIYERAGSTWTPWACSK